MELGAHLRKYFSGRDSGTDVLWQVLAMAPLSCCRRRDKNGGKDIGAPTDKGSPSQRPPIGKVRRSDRIAKEIRVLLLGLDCAGTVFRKRRKP
jgi:hypothetical protein